MSGADVVTESCADLVPDIYIEIDSLFLLPCNNEQGKMMTTSDIIILEQTCQPEASA